MKSFLIAVSLLGMISQANAQGIPGTAGSVGAAGVNGIKAQSIQGITGGVPIPTIQAGALPAGSNALGTVGVTTLPSLPAGGNTIGSVGQSGTWSVNLGSGLPAGINAIGTVGVTSLPSLPAGSAAIGSVSVSNLPATQQVQGIVGGVPQPVAPSSASAAACQGGTGSTVTSVTTTASTVCAGTSGARTFFNIQGTSGTYAGTALGGCTWDGSTPTSAAYDFALFGAGASTNSAGLMTIPNNPIICVSFSGTLSIKATAIQTGTAP